jgi:hypothetical protein
MRFKFLALALWVCSAVACAAPVQWFDGQHWQTAWVNDATGAVALEAGGRERGLAPALSVVTQPGQASAVALNLSALGYLVKPSPVPDKLYVRIAADQVLAATARMAGLEGILTLQLQWVRHVGMPRSAP